MQEATDLFGEEIQEGTPVEPKKPRHSKVVFKAEQREQQWLLPPSLDELIGPANLARFIDALVDHIDLTSILKKYKGGGAGAFHPGTLLKIWLLAYCRRLFTSRPIEKALTSDVEFMWISGMQRPSHVTLSTFRRQLGKEIKDVFRSTVTAALQAGLIDGRELFIDHTKMVADVNKHKVSWKKNIDRYLAKVNSDIDKLLALIDHLNEEEEKTYVDEAAREKAVEGITGDFMKELVYKINIQIKSGEKDKETGAAEKKMLRKGVKKKDRKEAYEEKLEVLDGRSGMSNMDTEASAMMLKDNATIRPAYNVGVATQNGIVVGFDVSNNANDSVSFKAVLDNAAENLGRDPNAVSTDAGYGTHEVYTLLEKRRIAPYVKYPGWLRDEKGRRGKFEAVSFTYIEEQDCWKCPNGSLLAFEGTFTRKNKRTGFEETIRKYQAAAEDCSACPHKGECSKGASRSIQVNPELNRQRREARDRLKTDKGRQMRARRSAEVESVFGDQKWNNKFDRFHLKGILGATIESGLFYSCRNIKKLHKCFIAFAHSRHTGVKFLAPRVL